jgi:NADPH:quinone reductase-like Zn-dependent oxidoreductase
MMTIQFPVIPGRDVAGEVVAVGADVKQPVPIARLGQFWDSAVVTLRDIK